MKQENNFLIIKIILGLTSLNTKLPHDKIIIVVYIRLNFMLNVK